MCLYQRAMEKTALNFIILTDAEHYLMSLFFFALSCISSIINQSICIRYDFKSNSAEMRVYLIRVDGRRRFSIHLSLSAAERQESTYYLWEVLTWKKVDNCQLLQQSHGSQLTHLHKSKPVPCFNVIWKYVTKCKTESHLLTGIKITAFKKINKSEIWI